MSEALYQIMGRHRSEPLPERKPPWLKVKAPGGPNYIRLKHLMRELDLHSVCEEAHCPNVGECWEHGTATFMILGDVCTRNCAYCAVAHGRPPKYDIAEPHRVAKAIAEMGLQHAVITSVDRDDIPTKTGMILGMGETMEEVVVVMRDLREVDVDILTLGQYLRPSDAHIALDRYYTPQEFRQLYEIGMEMGFRHVESGPLVRSSYHAWEQVQAAGV